MLRAAKSRQAGARLRVGGAAAHMEADAGHVQAQRARRGQQRPRGPRLRAVLVALPPAPNPGSAVCVRPACCARERRVRRLQQISCLPVPRETLS